MSSAPRELEARVRSRSGVSAVRFIARATDEGFSYEPFSASAAVDAWLRIPKKNDAAVAIVVSTLIEAEPRCRQG